MLLLDSCCSERPALPPRAMGTSGPKLLLMAVLGSAIAGVCVDVPCPYYNAIWSADENHVLNCVLKRKGHAELAGPTPH